MKKKEICEKFCLREVNDYWTSNFVFKPKYKVSERVKYRDISKSGLDKGIRTTQIKKIELIQLRKNNDISYKLCYSTGRKWIDEGQIIDYE